MSICLGMKPDGTLLNTTFKDCHHLVIGGYSGCGKTTLSNNILMQLSNTIIYIFDIKDIDYKRYNNPNNIIKIANNSRLIRKYLDEILAELHKRICQRSYDIPIIVLLDAFELYDYPRCANRFAEIDFDVVPYLIDIIDCGAKFGIHLILTSQYTTNTEKFKHIKRNSSIICMSYDHRKFFFVDREKKEFPNNANTLCSLYGKTQLIELIPKYLPLVTKII